MAIIKPFRGLRPPKHLVEYVNCRPYDVLSSDEARNEAADNEMSLYHITRPEIDFPAGSSIFLYTDGVTEAENEAKELYSEDRLLKIIEDMRYMDNPETVVDSVLNDVKSHAGDAEQSDDITMLYVKYNPE